MIGISNIKWRLKWKLKSFFRWLGRPWTVNKAVKQAKQAMEKLGTKVVYTSIHDKEQKGCFIVIISGYIPGKACMLTTKFNYGDFDDYKFTVDGQIADGKWGLISYGKDHIFNRVDRHPGSGESYGSNSTFSINTYSAFNSGTMNEMAANKIRRGMAFFGKFIEEYGDTLAERFTSSIFLWFVPEHSKEFKELEEKNSENKRQNYIGFNAQAMKAFPSGFFSHDQRP